MASLFESILRQRDRDTRAQTREKGYGEAFLPQPSPLARQVGGFFGGALETAGQMVHGQKDPRVQLQQVMQNKMQELKKSGIEPTDPEFYKGLSATLMENGLVEESKQFLQTGLSIAEQQASIKSTETQTETESSRKGYVEAQKDALLAGIGFDRTKLDFMERELNISEADFGLRAQEVAASLNLTEAQIRSMGVEDRTRIRDIALQEASLAEGIRQFNEEYQQSGRAIDLEYALARENLFLDQERFRADVTKNGLDFAIDQQKLALQRELQDIQKGVWERELKQTDRELDIRTNLTNEQMKQFRAETSKILEEVKILGSGDVTLENRLNIQGMVAGRMMELFRMDGDFDGWFGGGMNDEELTSFSVKAALKFGEVRAEFPNADLSTIFNLAYTRTKEEAELGSHFFGLGDKLILNQGAGLGTSTEQTRESEVDEIIKGIREGDNG